MNGGSPSPDTAQLRMRNPIFLSYETSMEPRSGGRASEGLPLHPTPSPPYDFRPVAAGWLVGLAAVGVGFASAPVRLGVDVVGLEAAG
jgi:hypothetical protein